MDRFGRNTILVLCGLLFSFANEKIETTQLSPDELKKDVSVLRKALEGCTGILLKMNSI
jgi:hypothetical protein